ncbi:MAG: HEPN domain-containing protein [Firmicutes bacterium]|jgi:HEPN domain-containing protein|nr:HEPN domain-containing protein [Bacillota bacterium]
MREEARRWIAQADADLAHARASIRTGFHFAAAFACHQAAEKWLKGAIIERRRSMPPKTHNLVELGRWLEVPEEILSDLRLLNPEYATSRYPDAANGVPAENYDERRATMLLEAAERVHQWVTAALTGRA